MSKIDMGGPAYRPPLYERDEYTRVWKEIPNGATWLDVCAWHAMGSIIIANNIESKILSQANGDTAFSATASAAYKYAQAMLAEKRRLESEGE